ncbi:MAG: DUF3419 family protein [Bacteriovoracaceae bacterium]|nr:DUF3419 family protein [Bacteriovoracaceae bacterium]
MAQKYFNSLNYTLGNEDTTLEVEMIKKLKPQSIFSVCGSGGRSLPLINEKTKTITLCDLSKYQLALAELRHVTYKKLSHQDFLVFWGYCPFGETDYSRKRKELFHSLELAADTKKFFEELFLEIDYQSVLYLGKWEKTFKVLASICKVLLGQKVIDKLFSFHSIEDQKRYYETEFPQAKWKLVLFLLGNKSVFNALLYKGDFIKKNDPQTHFQYYFSAFDRLFTTVLARESFFLNLCFFGKIRFHEGNPIESSSETHERIKNSDAQVSFYSSDMIQYLSSGKNKYDFLSLSDVPSYFGGDLEKSFLQQIKSSLNPGAIVVIRYYLRICDTDINGYKDVTNDYADLLRHEKVQMYKVNIYQFKS